MRCPGSGGRTDCVLRYASPANPFDEVQAPTLVLHGEDDPIIRTSAARAVAREIRGSKLLILTGVGHDLPSVSWKTVAEQTRRLVEPSR